MKCVIEGYVLSDVSLTPMCCRLCEPVNHIRSPVCSVYYVARLMLRKNVSV